MNFSMPSTQSMEDFSQNQFVGPGNSPVPTGLEDHIQKIWLQVFLTA